MNHRLPPQAWMESGPVRKIMSAFEAVRPDSALFVGGCVRDALLGRPVSDIDIATQLPPDLVARHMEAAGFAVHPTGIAHGTLTVVVDHAPFEVTTLRRDVSTDGRRATVAFTEDWAEDARRRDFRMNALYASVSGEVLDPTGSGVADIAAGRVVFVGDPDTRIREDYLRVLRFFRFSAWFARQGLDAAGLEACARGVAGLKGLSAERVWGETRKLLLAPDPRSALFAMDAAGLLEALYPWSLNPRALTSLVAFDLAASQPPDALLRVLALCALDPAAVDAAVKSLKMSNAEAARLRSAARSSYIPDPCVTDEALRRAVHASGAESVMDRIRVVAARARAPEDWMGLLARVRAVNLPDFPVAGADLVASGVPPGPEVGRWMDELEARWVASDFRDSREDLLRHVRRP